MTQLLELIRDDLGAARRSLQRAARQPATAGAHEQRKVEMFYIGG